eukprot:6471481-Amphidinium_carterae.1
MQYAATLLDSLDLVVNVDKSAISAVGPTSIPAVIVQGKQVPCVRCPDVLGSTLAPASEKLAPPSGLPVGSTSRSVQRWCKIKDRLSRLERLPLTCESKAHLWRSLVLPIVGYDTWALLPTRASASAWTSKITRAIYYGIRGSIDRKLVCAHCPHQLDVLGIFLHLLAKEVVPLIADEPLLAFFDDKCAPINTPISALTQMFRLAGFEAQPEGILHASTGALLDWPPTTVPQFLHQLRDALRQACLASAAAPTQWQRGSVLHPQLCSPATCLTRTQRNFLYALQFHSHRAKEEGTCPLCGQPGGLEHAIWHCDSRPLPLVCEVPAEVETLPVNLRKFALVLTSEEVPRQLVDSVQDYMTRVLIARRLLQQPMDRESRKRKKTHAEADVEEICSSGEDAADIHPESVGPACGDHSQGSDAPVLPPPHVPRAQRARQAAHKRRKWDTSQLPQHIQLVQGQFQEHYLCTFCGYKSLRQARSPFFQKHWG